MLLEYLGDCSVIKLPINKVGSACIHGGITVYHQCFITYPVPAVGPVIIDLDAVSYPYAAEFALGTPRALDGSRLYVTTAEAATVGSPVLHHPALPNAHVVPSA